MGMLILLVASLRISVITATGDLCKDNEHVSSGSCVPCAAGHTRHGGDDPSGGHDTVCSTCAENHSVEWGTTGWECVRCCEGYTRAAGDDFAVLNHATQCDRCAAYYHAAEDTEDTAATFTSGLHCAKCEDDTWRDAGDSVAARKTATECFTRIDYTPGLVCGILFVVLFVWWKTQTKLSRIPCWPARARYELRKSEKFKAELQAARESARAEQMGNMQARLAERQRAMLEAPNARYGGR